MVVVYVVVLVDLLVVIGNIGVDLILGLLIVGVFGLDCLFD